MTDWNLYSLKKHCVWSVIVIVNHQLANLWNFIFQKWTPDFVNLLVDIKTMILHVSLELKPRYRGEETDQLLVKEVVTPENARKYFSDTSTTIGRQQQLLNAQASKLGLVLQHWYADCKKLIRTCARPFWYSILHLDQISLYHSFINFFLYIDRWRKIQLQNENFAICILCNLSFPLITTYYG